jgi:hypothetical protein
MNSTKLRELIVNIEDSDHSCSAVQHISIDMCLNNLFFLVALPLHLLTVLQVRHKECGRFLQIVFMWEGDD